MDGIALARKAGIVQSSISRYVTGKGSPRGEEAVKLARALGVSCDLLLTGHDPPAAVRLEDLPQPRIIWSDAIDANDRNGLAATEQMKQAIHAEDYRAIPIVEGSVAAGAARVVSEQIEGFAVVYQPSLGNRTNLVAVRVSGDSMSPILTDGSMVIVDRGDRRIRPGMAFLVRVDGGVTVKFLELDGQDLVLIAENRAYRDQRVRLEAGQESPVCGVVVWSWRAWAATEDDSGQAGEKKARYRAGRK